jgi:hypothetical protein
MLNPSDVYVEGGTNDLLVCWTDKVTKYDASSFYNWEQDNLPLHDLDERTHLLWERLGHPTSAITGMSFIVSGDATSSCNPLYFTDLSSCLEAMPEVINYPILIEVASFGNLGDLHLSNKIFGPNGSLEIVNRNSAFAGSVDLNNQPMSLDQIDSDFTDFSLASSVSSLQDASAPSITFDLFNSFLYTNNQFIASASNRWQDVRYSLENQYVFTRRVGKDQLGAMTASLSSTVSAWANDGTLEKASSGLVFDRYDVTYRSTDSMNTYDASTTDQIDNNQFFPVDGLSNGADVDDIVAASLYFNHLNSIKVTNCNGPIYIRNFTVDGQKSKEKGIEITNSTVNLERCSASRCTKAGLYATNSDVKLLRGFVAFRNYGYEDGVRVGQNYGHKINNYTTLDSYGAGIYAENSTIEFKNTYARDIEKSSQASSLVYTDSYAGDLPVPSQENLYCLSRNDIGIHAVNSNILGGRTELDGSATNAWQDAVQVFSELNTEAGARLNNCNLNLKGRFTLYGNYFGLDAKNSDVSFDFFKAYGNQREGMKLDGCSFIYNNNLYTGWLDTIDYTFARDQYLQHQVTLLRNGGAIEAHNSTISPVYTSSMPDIYESFMVSGDHGVYIGNERFNVKPNIVLDSSKLDAIHASIYPTANGDIEEACLGEAISAKNGSEVYLRGSKEYANKVIGGNTDSQQQRRAGIYANNNSTVSLQGPTVMARFGVDVLVDNNSQLDICPHRDSDGMTMVSSFNLDDRSNHTIVELHSTRACVVADNGSVLNFQDLGSYHDLWANPDGTYGPALDLTRNDYLKTDQAGTSDYVSSVSGGSLQFYPNAFLNTGIPFNPAALADEERKFTIGSYTPQSHYYLLDMPESESDKLATTGVSSVTTGGMCVRALNQSKVNAINVHFPAGQNQMSSVIYDFDGVDGLEAACTRPPIWNIADDSILKASYLAVSGYHPQDAGYVGPSGNWYSASEAPESTPDTSSLSVLDYYGRDGGNQNIFGQSTAKNYGAFRLFFSVDPLTNYLIDPDQVLSGYATQVFSQGYNFSGPLSAASTDVANEYTKALFSPEYYTTSDAGFYYASSMVHSPKTVKAVLDDSAMNTFANAKHNTVNKSGLANVVTRYEPFDTGIGGDSTSNKDSGKGVASVNNFNLRKLN